MKKEDKDFISQSKYAKKVEFERIRDTLRICMYEKLKQRRPEKGNFLSLFIIVAQGIRHIIPILVHFKKFFVSTRLKGYLSHYCSNAIVHIDSSQTLQICMKMSQKSEETKSSEPKIVTNAYRVKMLGVKMGVTPKKLVFLNQEASLMNKIWCVMLYLFI